MSDSIEPSSVATSSAAAGVYRCACVCRLFLGFGGPEVQGPGLGVGG